jgi:hypothetical protein
MGGGGGYACVALTLCTRVKTQPRPHYQTETKLYNLSWEDEAQKKKARQEKTKATNEKGTRKNEKEEQDNLLYEKPH